MTVRSLSPLTHRSQSRINDSQHVKPIAFIFSPGQYFPTASISASPTIAFPLPSIIFTIYCIHTDISSPFGIHPFPDDAKSITVTSPVPTFTTVPRHALSVRSPCSPAPIRYPTILVLLRDISVRFSRPSVPEPSRGIPQCHQTLSSDEEFFWRRP
jgi:hypothetical protein